MLGFRHLWSLARTASMVRAIARDDRGQALVLMTIAMTAFLGMAALTIDIGATLQERRQLQNAVDAATLAAVSAVPADPAQADALARFYLAANGVDVNDPAVTYQFQSPYNGDASLVRVEVSRSSTTFFAGVLGINQLTPAAGAVAERVAAGAGRALFAIGTSCGGDAGIKINGSVNNVVGGVHSNSDIQVSGSNNTITGGTTHVCGFQNGGGGNSYTPAPGPGVVEPPPVNFVYADFPCDIEFSGNVNLTSEPAVWLNGDKNTNQLLPGVYCSTGTLTISGSDVVGNVTLASVGRLSISGSNFTLTPFFQDVLFYTDSTMNNALDVSGSGGTWEGYMLAPSGRAQISGSGNLSVNGSVIADEITVSGSDFTLNSTGYGESTPAFHLTE